MTYRNAIVKSALRSYYGRRVEADDGNNYQLIIIKIGAGPVESRLVGPNETGRLQ